MTGQPDEPERRPWGPTPEERDSASSFSRMFLVIVVFLVAIFILGRLDVIPRWI